MVELWHPVLKRTVTVNERRAERLIRDSGWRLPLATGGLVRPDPALVIGDPFLQPPAKSLSQNPAEEADPPTPSKED